MTTEALVPSLTASALPAAFGLRPQLIASGRAVSRGRALGLDEEGPDCEEETREARSSDCSEREVAISARYVCALVVCRRPGARKPRIASCQLGGLVP